MKGEARRPMSTARLRAKSQTSLSP
ncbi:MAG: hypothetical protein CISAcid_00710 [uncultured Acidilobus sp. CIS]|jgi:hypothetical protein|nr:MAG: hypothetical protein CISAcid_00710 [uncultured Acidilobus sp. CIS]